MRLFIDIPDQLHRELVRRYRLGQSIPYSRAAARAIESEMGTKVRRYDDGSTDRTVRGPVKVACQNVAFSIIDAAMERDHMAAQEAWEELTTDAERYFVNAFLTSAQSDFVREALHQANLQGGWDE